MIAPLGYAVLRDYSLLVFSETLKSLRENYDCDPPPWLAMELTFEALNKSLSEASNLSVYSPTGNHHSISRDILNLVKGTNEAGETRIGFAFIDAHSMKVDLSKVENLGQSARARNCSLEEPKEMEFKFDYSGALVSIAEELRPIDGFYLTCLADSLTTLRGQALFEKLFPLDLPKEEIADLDQIEATLRSAIQSGNLPIRDEFKRRFAPSLKSDSFRAIWRDVATDYPEISKSGPKSRASKFNSE